MDNYNEDRNKNIELCLEECKDTLKRLAYKYRSVYNGDTDEAFANACLWLVELYDKFDRDKASFVTYIGCVIENKFLDDYRKHKVYDLDVIGTDIQDLDELGIIPSYDNVSDEFDCDKEELTPGQIDRYEIYLEYQNQLDILKEKERDVFKLFYYNMWDISKIANAYDLSEIRIKEIKRNALNKLMNS